MRMSRSLGSRHGRPACLRRLPGFAAVAGLLAALAFGGGRASAQVSLFDPRFEEVRKASVTWDNRPGPSRQVVDMVCLVPDLPTFFEAVAAWDEAHYFPVLIDDVELTFKFLRAFRPARIVRYPSKAAAIPPDKVWEKAVAAVGKAWSSGNVPADRIPRGDAPPASLGPTPPGVVVSTPDSPSLAGAVALAAGRFQPLLKWETPKHFADVIPEGEARDLSLSLDALVSGCVPRYDALGDDCDFVTLAGDYPYRYTANNQSNAFDDLILRSARTGSRWAFAGRIMGDPVQSAYRAMCSLFLSPSTALMYNTYQEKEPPWSQYAMTRAAAVLGKVLPVTHRSGPRAGLAGWHQTFDPVNRFGLVVLNSHGNPTTFHLEAGPGQTADIPESGPAVVLMIHSFSADMPTDPDTIAGRWLANGAYAFYGSMNEPYLHAFRTPGLASSFLAENLPVVVSQRQTSGEAAAQPWRLVYFGDPLYRLKPLPADAGRTASWGPVDGWRSYGEYLPPAPNAAEGLRLNWALKAAIFRLQTGTAPRQKTDLPGTLLGIARDRLEPPFRPLYDDLLADTLFQAGRTAELIDRLSRIPPAERSPAVRRHLETAQTAALQRAASTNNFRQALSLWGDVIRARGSRDFARVFTERVGRLADTPVKRAEWQSRLRASQRANADPDNAAVIEAELKRVGEQRKGER